MFVPSSIGFHVQTCSKVVYNLSNSMVLTDVPVLLTDLQVVLCSVQGIFISNVFNLILTLALQGRQDMKTHTYTNTHIPIMVWLETVLHSQGWPLTYCVVRDNSKIPDLLPSSGRIVGMYHHFWSELFNIYCVHAVMHVWGTILRR